MRPPALLALAVLLGAALPSPGAAAGPTVIIHQDLAPGEWVLVQVFTPPTSSVSFSGSLEVRTQGPLGRSVGLFSMPPAAMIERPGRYDLVAGPDTPLVEIESLGGSLARSEDLAGIVSAPGIMGVQLGFAASHAWRLDLTLTVAQATFAVVNRYPGATFAERTAPVTPVAGTHAYTFQVPDRGWTHLGTDAMHLQPDGIRRWDVSFPNGFRSTGACEMYGANALVTALVTHNSCAGGFGATINAPGPLHVNLTYAEASPGAPLEMVHMPWPPQHGVYAIDYSTREDGLDVSL